MTCRETRELIHAYVDGELDIVRSTEIERHLKDCEVCALTCENQRSLSALLQAGPLYYRAPASLENRIRASLNEPHGTATEVQTSSEKVSRRFWVGWKPGWKWACAALAVMILSVVVLRNPTSSREDSLAREVASSHIRSLMANHLTDIDSSDQHTVKPWFDGRLDFSPPVVNLTSQGFPLVGGRLDYLNGRAVAAIVYRRRKHLINVFIWPRAGTGGGLGATAKETALQGYNILHWTKSGMNFWVVSDLNTQELREFSELLRSAS